MHEVERYQLDIVRLSSTHGLGSETSFLDRGWTLFQTGLGLCGYIGMLLGGCREATVFFSPSDGDSLMLLGDFNAHMGNNSEMWSGVIERTNLNLGAVLLLDFCEVCP